MKYKGRDDTIVGRVTNRATTQARAAWDKSSQLRAGRVILPESHQKQLVEQGHFRAPHITRRRVARSDKQLRDDVEDVHA